MLRSGPLTPLSDSLGGRVCLRVASSLLLASGLCKITRLVRKEQSWHRLLRRKRQQARDLIRRCSSLTLGRKRRKKLRKALDKLQWHHAWRFQDISLRIRDKIKMTWYCQVCKVQNGQKFDTCRGCQGHWSTVWKEPVKNRRSRSKSKAAKQAEQQEQQSLANQD